MHGILSHSLHSKQRSSFLQDEQNVRPNFLQGQEVTGNMRAILVDWLVQVNLKFRLLQETMYMTVGLLDRFLQVRTSAGLCR